MNVFPIAPNDQSVYYLGRIFGSIGTVLTGTGPALLGQMFSVFNTAVLVLGAILITYSIIKGTIATGHEGKFLGDKMHQIWTPIRSVAGIAALMPIPNSGYCAAQVIVMWIIMQGIGAADNIWNAMVDYIAQGGAIVTQGMPTTIGTTSGSNTLQFLGPSLGASTLFQYLVCQESLNFYEQKYVLIKPIPVGSVEDDTDMQYKFGVMNPTQGSPQDATPYCGYVSWAPLAGSSSGGGSSGVVSGSSISGTSGAATLATVNAITGTPSGGATVSDIQKTFYLTAVPTMQALAKYFAKQADTFCAPGTDCTTQQSAQNFWFKYLYPYAGSNFVNNIATLYVGALNNLAAANVNYQKQTPYGNAYDFMKAVGWIFAGAYYYQIAVQNNKSADLTNTPMAFNGSTSTPTPIPFDKTSTIYSNFGADIANAAGPIYTFSGQVMNVAAAVQNQGGSNGQAIVMTNQGSQYTQPMFALVGGIFTGFKDLTSNHGQDNPLVQIQRFGYQILLAVQITWGMFFALIIASLIVGAVTSSINSVGYMLSGMWSYLVPMILFLLGSLLVLGGMMAVYVPLIPYIVFTFGAIGWLMECFELMVAAPIVAFGVLHPEGQHEVMGKAEPAVQIIVTLFLRPSLMLFGMGGGMLLSYVVITMINAGFFQVVSGLDQNQGPIEGVVLVAAYDGFVLTALNKCFDLIHVIPERILRVLGVQGAGGLGGEKEATGEIKQRAEAGAAGAGKGFEQTGGAAAKSSGAPAEAIDSKKMKDKADNYGKSTTGTIAATPPGQTPPGQTPTNPGSNLNSPSSTPTPPKSNQNP